MTGLEKIIEHIREDAETARQAAMKEAAQEVAEITEDGEKQAKQITEKWTEKLQADRANKLSRNESTCDLTRRRLLLKAKQSYILDVIESAKQKLKTLPDADYFSTLLRMIDRYGLNKPGEIVFSPKDITRIPASFSEQLTKRGLKLSEQNRKLDGGFILIYGDIEENCSFDALFAAAGETLQDKVRDILFE